MAETSQGAKKKIKQIKVRKPHKLGVDEVSSTISAHDSNWQGIEFKSKDDDDDPNPEPQNGYTENETEVKIIDMDAEETPPLILLFPDLKDEFMENRLYRHVRHDSTSSDEAARVLAHLKGKQPNMALFKQCKKLPRMTRLTAVEEEEAESSSSSSEILAKFETIIQESEISMNDKQKEDSYLGDESEEILETIE